MLVSIVIPAYNACATIERCVRASKGQTHSETEVIVVDDGSSDDTANLAERNGANVIKQHQGGPAAARNAGAKAARGGIVAFTDSDCVPHSDWIEKLLVRFSTGVVGVGGSYGIANASSWLACMIHEEIVIRHDRMGDTVDYLGSFNVAYRREAFIEAGGFNEDFKAASGEDNDLAYRLHDKGGILRFTRDACVDHYHPEKLGKYLKSQMGHGFWRVKLLALHGQRRAGDQYAGTGELLGLVAASVGLPIAALCAVLALISRTGNGVALWLISIGLLAFCLLFHMTLPLLIVRRTRRVSALLYALVLAARSIARTVGLLHGILHFLILKRKTV
jgi:glycosyltransferase involved in cell wall biosynthesis